MDRLAELIAAPGILVAHRLIAAGDEQALLAAEAVCFDKASLQARRQSGAARIAARALLSRLGAPDAAIAKAPSGAPLWPAGFVGSLAHDELVALAAVARATDFASVGIDIEPDADLPDELVDLVATPAERALYDAALLRGRALFVAKEAVFKAVHPLDGVFLDFHDIEVDLDGGIARLRSGRAVAVRVAVGAQSGGGHIAALAFIRTDEG
ncbi:4'-phosphopantetheinyl transferase [Rhodoblastus sp.]|uniref:4'-phosphopantetheinyl transferase family protein n=1 Tax=Rhodoblastus sp. TaxID=1962975 RepID=UPI0035B11509